MNYEEYEIQCDKIREENERYLEKFQEDLIGQGLAEKTIRKHCGNVDFYINVYLLHEDTYSMNRGCGYLISDFLGYFLIRKCAWSTRGTIKTTAASLKKFYKSMMEHGNVDKENYEMFCDIVKSEMADWQNLCDQYNDPSCENPFNPFSFDI